MYPLFSTTTCERFLPSTFLPATTTPPTSAGNPYQFRREVCVTVNSVRFGGSTTTVSSSSTELTLDGQMQVYFFGIVLFIAMLFFFRDIFKVDRYE